MHPSRIRPYAELRASSSFSFLAAAASPEDLAMGAVERGLASMALVDVNGVQGAPRFHRAAREAGLRALVGTELRIEGAGRLTVLVENGEGYRNLCRGITSGALAHPKGQGRIGWSTLEEHAPGLHCLTGGDESPLHRLLRARSFVEARVLVDRLVALFPGRLHIEIQRHHLREEAHLEHALLAIARRHHLPVVATNGVRYVSPADKDLLDVLTCMRHRTQLDAAGPLLDENREREVRGAAEMSERFADLPGSLDAAHDLAGRLEFTLENLGYRFPEFPLPPGENANS